MKKIKYLEGLRGVGAFAVFFDHLGFALFTPSYEIRLFSIIHNISFLPDFLKDILIHIIILFTNGELAVWIFWLLSSYVISIAFFKKNNPYNKILISYFSKRYIRLFIPVFFSILFAYLLLSFGLMYNHNVALTFTPPNTTLNSLYSFKPDIVEVIRSGFFTTFFNFQESQSYNSVLWTIQPEFLGSLLIFGMFGIIRHNAKRYILYGIITIILIASDMLPLLAFVIGYVLCDYDFSETENKIILSIKKIETNIHQYKLPFFIGSTLLILYGRGIMNFMKVPPANGLLIIGIFVIYFCLRNEYYKKILSSRIPYWLGEISFSLYLIHVPIICSLGCFIVFHHNNLKGEILASFITIVVTVPLSVLYTKYIDKKAVSLSNKVGDYFKKYS